ncbi:MAG: DinB family protein [Anaerolineales bacterium]
MDLQHYLSQMEQHASAIRSLAEGISDEQARWKPDPESWSLLEVINHLYDEERQDFRVRLNYILYRPGEPWPSIDPQGWVTSRGYNQRDLKESLANFLSERSHSLAWLRGLDALDWQTAAPTPWGQITAGDMFAAWVSHDLLHLRQLVELHYAYTTQDVRPYTPEYAGEW